MSSIAIGGKWEDLKVKISPLIISFLKDELFFNSAAPVQAQSIPLLLGNYDIVVEAITGSGKTLSYLIPCFEILLRESNKTVMKMDKSAVMAVMIAPSRELAQQVAGLIAQFLKYLKGKGIHITSGCFIGGRDVEADIALFTKEGANIIVGTPGRLYELLVVNRDSHLFHLCNLELLVLDEADRLLEFGFKAKLDSLLQRLPNQRRTALFSATQTKELADLARAGMRNPVAITVRTTSLHGSADGNSTQHAKPQIPEKLINYYAITPLVEKLDRLVECLKAHKQEKVLVYVMTCAEVDWMYQVLHAVLLKGQGFNIYSLHGQMLLKTRQKACQNVHKSQSCVLVCTDVAARGLDIPEVGVVLQYEPPVDPHTFIHRIGRTARMEKEGTSVVFLIPEENEYIPFMQLQNVTLSPLDVDRDDVDIIDFEKVDKCRTLESAEDGKKPRFSQYKKKRKEHLRLKTKEDIKAEMKKRRGEVTTEMCESSSVLAIRRASRAKSELMSLGTRAFVSFIRAYKEHECRYIFQLKKIDIVDLVHSFALFKVPNCGEIRKMTILRISIQEEFNDIMAALAEKKRKRKEEQMIELEQKKERVDNGDEDDDNLNPKKKHCMERNRQLEELRNEKTLSRNARAVAFRQAEIDEIMRDSYYIRKERAGKISSKAVDKISGIEGMENAIMTTRERQENRKIKKKRH